MSLEWYQRQVKSGSDKDLMLDQVLRLIPMNVVRDISEGVLRTEGALPSWFKNTFEYMCNVMHRSGIKRYEKLFARWEREGFLSSHNNVQCPVCKGTGDHPRLQNAPCYYCGGVTTVKSYKYVGDTK